MKYKKSNIQNLLRLQEEIIIKVSVSNCNRTNVSLKTNEGILVDEPTTVVNLYNLFFKKASIEVISMIKTDPYTSIVKGVHIPRTNM